jgi:hypothetical protein
MERRRAFDGVPMLSGGEWTPCFSVFICVSVVIFYHRGTEVMSEKHRGMIFDNH